MASNITVTPEDLDALHSTCTTQAQQVDSVRTTVDGKIRGTNWKSAASERFTADWERHHKKGLAELSQALQELGRAAREMAENYRRADQSYHGSGG
ncbi:MAG: WXG100 family type VII secretion target [Actinomycetota bacterium]|nr:WXG100 family type VII secretion target [Actinomycetota bacterium]